MSSILSEDIKLLEDDTLVAFFKYRTYMSTISILPNILMGLLQQQNIKREIANKISFGTSFNYAINKISNQFSHALMLSLGIRTQLDNPRLGLGISINNIGKILDDTHGMNEYIPTSINTSTFYSPQNFPGVLLLDISKFHNTNSIQIRLGLEITIKDYIYLRFGNSNNALDLSDSYSSYFPGLSGGVGVQSKKWDIDIGFFNLESAGIVTGLSLIYKK